MKLSEYSNSLSAMLAAQKGIATTKQNISNLHTAGYVRQRVELQAAGPKMGNSLSGGYGVEVTGVVRVTDDIKRQQYNYEAANVAYYDYVKTNLSNMETSVGMTGDTSIPNAVDNFFFAWKEIAKSPNQLTNYQTLVSESKKLISQLNRVASDAGRINAGIAGDTKAFVDEWNRLSNELVEANKQIGQAGLNPPNALLDERDRILGKLSELTKLDVSYESQNPNIATVRVNGMIAVSGIDRYALELSNENGTAAVKLHGEILNLESGKIQAAIHSKEKYMDSYVQNLDSFVVALKNRVNELAGLDFFVGDTAGTVNVNPAFEQAPATMSFTVATANAVAGVMNETMPSGQTYGKFMDTFIVGIAADVNEASAYADVHQDLLTGIEAERAGIEGVNMDEEMVNLMMYQNYFSANSKAVRTLNEMYDALFALI